MLNSYTLLTDFANTIEAASNTLMDMKRNLDQYKLSTNANAASVEIREKQLLHLVRLVRSCDAAFTALNTERDAAYKEGFRRGQELCRTESNHSVSSNWGKRYRNNEEKEAARFEHNYRADSNWGDHF